MSFFFLPLFLLSLQYSSLLIFSPRKIESTVTACTFDKKKKKEKEEKGRKWTRQWRRRKEKIQRKQIRQHVLSPSFSFSLLHVACPEAEPGVNMATPRTSPSTSWKERTAKATNRSRSHFHPREEDLWHEDAARPARQQKLFDYNCLLIIFERKLKQCIEPVTSQVTVVVKFIPSMAGELSLVIASLCKNLQLSSTLVTFHRVGDIRMMVWAVHVFVNGQQERRALRLQVIVYMPYTHVNGPKHQTRFLHKLFLLNSIHWQVAEVSGFSEPFFFFSKRVVYAIVHVGGAVKEALEVIKRM